MRLGVSDTIIHTLTEYGFAPGMIGSRFVSISSSSSVSVSVSASVSVSLSLFLCLCLFPLSLSLSLSLCDFPYFKLDAVVISVDLDRFVWATFFNEEYADICHKTCVVAFQ